MQRLTVHGAMPPLCNKKYFILLHLSMLNRAFFTRLVYETLCRDILNMSLSSKNRLFMAFVPFEVYSFVGSVLLTAWYQSPSVR